MFQYFYGSRMFGKIKGLHHAALFIEQEQKSVLIYL